MDLYDYYDSGDPESSDVHEEMDDFVMKFNNKCNIVENGDIYGPNEYEPPLVMFARTGLLSINVF